jgi:hypothetical protein
MSGACSTHGVISNAYEIMVGKPEGNSEYLGLGERMIILEWTLEKYRKFWTRFM